MTEKTKKTHKITTPGIVTGALVAGLLLLLANTALWLNRQVFDTGNFTNTAKTALLSDSSRDALANEVVSNALANRPVVNRFAGDTLTDIVSGMLGSNQFNKLFDGVVSRAQSYLISPNQESIVIELATVKDPVERIVAAIGQMTDNSELTGQQVSRIPDTITLLDANKVPDLYSVSIAILWAGPLLLIAALVVLTAPYVHRRILWTYTLIAQGIAVVLAGIFALLIGPMVRPPVIGLMPDANIRTIVGNVFDAFIATFNSQSWWLIWLGVAAILIGVGTMAWPRIHKFYIAYRTEHHKIKPAK